jgi:hypothetical protein
MNTLPLKRSEEVLPFQRSDTIPPHPTCKGCFNGSLIKEDHYGAEGCKNMYRDDEDEEIDIALLPHKDMYRDDEDEEIDIALLPHKDMYRDEEEETDIDLYEVKEEEFQEKISKCPGCIDNQPNQLAHMDPPYGCLWFEMLNEI